MEVTLIRWPDEQGRRQRLSLAGGPRLLLLEDGASPPPLLDCLEDWIRVPAAEDEVRARVDALAIRRAAHDHDAPGMDADGVLRFRGKWVSLPPLETRMMELLHATDVRLGLVTNGEHWMLVDAPKGDTTGFASWYAGLWLEEQITLRAFRSLLGVKWEADTQFASAALSVF